MQINLGTIMIMNSYQLHSIQDYHLQKKQRNVQSLPRKIDGNQY